MIDAKELMPDNWIQDHKGNPVQVHSLVKCYHVGAHNKIRLVWKVNGLPEEDFAPMPLTLDLLEELGFILEYRADRVRIFLPLEEEERGLWLDFWTKNSLDHGPGDFVWMEECNEIGRGLDWLHELQQLYWMDADEELKITIWSMQKI